MQQELPKIETKVIAILLSTKANQEISVPAREDCLPQLLCISKVGGDKSVIIPQVHTLERIAMFVRIPSYEATSKATITIYCVRNDMDIPEGVGYLGTANVGGTDFHYFG